MKVVETWTENNWGRQATRLEIDGEVVYELADGEPEDNSLARNFNFNVEELLSRAYYAGEAGSGFEFVSKTVSWKEFFDG